MGSRDGRPSSGMGFFSCFKASCIAAPKHFEKFASDRLQVLNEEARKKFGFLKFFGQQFIQDFVKWANAKTGPSAFFLRKTPITKKK